MFLSDKKYFATDREPPEILLEKQDPKNILARHDSFGKSYAQYDNNYLVNETGTQNNSVENEAFYNPKNTASMTNTPHFRNSEAENHSTDPTPSLNMPYPPSPWTSFGCKVLLRRFMSRVCIPISLFLCPFSVTFHIDFCGNDQYDIPYFSTLGLSEFVRLILIGLSAGGLIRGGGLICGSQKMVSRGQTL